MNRKSTVGVLAVALLCSTFVGTASSATSDPNSASLDVRESAAALMKRTSAQPIRVTLTGSESFTLYMAPNGATEYKSGLTTRICKAPRPRATTTACWQRLGTGPWSKAKVPVASVRRQGLLETAASQVQGFVEYGKSVTYEKSGGVQDLNFRLDGTFDGQQLQMRGQFAAKSVTVGLYSQATGTTPYQEYRVRVAKAKVIKFPKK